jgi:hypothetical protein
MGPGDTRKKITTMTTATDKKSASKYSAAQEQRIRDAAAAGPLNQAVAATLAAEFGEGFSTKSVVAKITRMSLPYQRKVAVTKTGAKVESKEAICKEIAEFVQGNLDGLDKAPKPALQALRDALAG